MLTENRKKDLLFMRTKYFLILTIIVSMQLFLNTAHSYFKPVVICGDDNPAGNVEVDQVNITRGGFIRNQLVIRNTAIIDDFITKGAIYRGELNNNDEFVIEGFVENNNGPHSANGTINNRYFEFVKSGTGFLLTVRLIQNNGIFLSEPIANFFFNDCLTLSAE
jgi:hypothetical protein